MLQPYLNLPRSIYVLCVGTFVNRAGTFLVPFLTIYLKDQLGLGIPFATTAMGVFGLGSVVGAVVGGHLADRVGRRIVMVGAMFGGAAILLVFSVLDTAPTILLATFLFAAIGEMYRPAASAMMADVTTPLERPHAYALMYVSINIGFAIGPLVGGTLAEYSFRWLFWGDAATSSLYGLIILIAVRETLPLAGAVGKLVATTRGVAADSTAPAAVAGEADVKGEAGFDEREELGFTAALAHMLRNRTFVLLCVAAFLIAVTFMQALSTFPLFLQEMGFGPKQYGRIIAVNGVLIVIGQLPLTSLMQRYSRGWLLVWAAVLTAIGFGAKNFAVTESQFMLTIVILGRWAR